MTLANLALVLSGWAFKTSLIRSDGSRADHLSSAMAIMLGLVLLYLGLRR